MDGVVGKHVRAAPADDLVREHPADDAVDVDDRHFAVHAVAARERRLRVFDQDVVQGVRETVVLVVDAVHAETVFRLRRGLEDRREVESLRLPVLDRGVGHEGVGTADHVVDRPEPELCHDPPQFLGHHEEVVDHVLGGAGELGAQLLVLGRDPHRAGVEVALAHHDAAQGDQRGGGEAEFLGTEQRSDRHVPAGLQLAVGLQDHARAQVVHDQRLVGLRDAQFPGHAGVLDGRQR